MFDTEADKGKTKGVIIKQLNDDSNLLLAAKVTRALNKEIQDKELKKTSETMRKQLMSEFQFDNRIYQSFKGNVTDEHTLDTTV